MNSDLPVACDSLDNIPFPQISNFQLLSWARPVMLLMLLVVSIFAGCLMVQPYYERDGITIYNCDCREVVRFLDARVIDSIVTDPPYGLEFMGKAWDHGVPGFEFWDLLKVVCKPGAMLLAFGGTRKFHRLACAIEDAGWEIRDCINWLYGSGFPKSLDISKAIDKAAGEEREKVAVGNAVKRMIPGADQDKTGSWIKDNGREYQPGIEIPSTDAAQLWQGWGTALKPAWEPIIVAMKALDGTFAQNALKHGVAGLNIDGCRVETDDTLTGSGSAPLKHGGENSRPFHKTAVARGCNQSPLGRFPANVIHDGSDEVLAGFPIAPGQLADISRTAPSSKTSNVYGAMNREGEPSAYSENEGTVGFKMKPGARRLDSGSAARFFYCAKASKKDRGEDNTHPTVKPSSLMEYLLQLVSTPTGGLVLDPFMGSGSTLVAAKALGRKAIGIEINKEYCDIAIQRLTGN